MIQKSSLPENLRSVLIGADAGTIGSLFVGVDNDLDEWLVAGERRA
jgi:hypothetical protein